MNLNRLLYKLGLFCSTRKYLTLALVSLITILFGYLALQIEIKIGVLSLFEDNDSEVMKVHYANNNFGGMDYTFVSLTANTLEDAKKYADTLAETITKNDMISRVIHKLDTNSLMKYGFFFLEPDKIIDFKVFVKENQQDLINIFKDVHTTEFLMGFNKILERQIIENDKIEDSAKAMDLLEIFDSFLTVMGESFNDKEKLSIYKIQHSLQSFFFQGFLNSSFDFTDEYMLSKDKRSVLLLVMPVEQGGDMIFNTRFMAYLNTTLENIAADISGADFQIAGNTAVMADEYTAILKDTKLSSIVTFFLVLIIFFVFFRKPSDLLLISICLIFGIIWTCGMVYLYIGFLGFTTAFFSAILIGLGIDFAIHLMTRYAECRNQGRCVEEAVAKAVSGSGPGILTGSATTAAAFFILMICRFKGVSQLGFVAGIGVICITSIMFTLLPCMIAIRDSNTRITRRNFRTMRELSIFSDLAVFMIRYRWPALFLITLLSSVMAIAAVNIEFNYDFRSLEPASSRAIKANHHLEKAFGRSVDYGLVFADSIDDSRKMAKILKEKVSISQIFDISQYIPLHQPEKTVLIKPIKPLLAQVVVEKSPLPNQPMNRIDIDALAFTLRESGRMFLAVQQIAFLGSYIDIEDKCTEMMAHTLKLAEKLERLQPAGVANISSFQQILSTELQNLLANIKEAAKANPLGLEQLPGVIRDNYMGKDGRFMIYAYPKGYIWTRDRLEQITSDLRSVTADSTSSGILFWGLVNKMQEDFKFAICLSLLVVFIMVLASFRRISTAVIALIPLVLSTLWMLGTMAMLGLMFNLVNIAVIPIIIGIGIDDGVHLVHRYRTEQNNRIIRSVQHTGRAIFLTSITTMAGFGSLGIASYTAIATLGWVLLIGVFYCLLTSVIVLPVLFSIFESLNIKI